MTGPFSNSVIFVLLKHRYEHVLYPLKFSKPPARLLFLAVAFPDDQRILLPFYSPAFLKPQNNFHFLFFFFYLISVSQLRDLIYTREP